MSTSSTPSTTRSHNSAHSVNVMLVDDSAVIRGSVARILREDATINIVSSVADGQMAVGAAERHQPDIIILDVEMPVMDGLTALPKILEVSPNSKVIMFSSLTDKGADVSLKAVSLGAVECLVKPTSGQDTGKGSDFQRYLLKLISTFAPKGKGAAAGASTARNAVSPAASAAPAPSSAKSFELHNDADSYTGRPSLVAIGSSTGGPQALFNVLHHFKGFNVPTVITQHMPAKFTKTLATHIAQKTGIEAVEVEDGMPLENGKIYVAQGGYHMLLDNSGGALRAKLGDGPAENFCKPAVDPMFRSAIEIYGRKVLGVILTGMGHDGLQGGEALVKKGGRLIAQDEKSSVVWGMPRAVAEAGICSEVLPIDEIGPWVRRAVLG